MTVKEVIKLLREYNRLNEKIFGFNQAIRRCQAEKDDALAVYPQMPEGGVRSGQTNSISDPTYQAVSRAITIYDNAVEKLAENMRICAYKKDIVDAMLEQLTVEECDAVDYFYFRGLRPIHIASKLSMSESTFYRTKKRALKKMADFATELER
jgi:DNA-directed RNA polymerase specialized sigma24 family protein